MSKTRDSVRRGARIRGFGFCLPGEPVALESLELSPGQRDKLNRLGQEFAFVADVSSTELMVEAASDALARTGIPVDRVRHVITAPSLITGQGLEIPAVAIRARLGLRRAECLNIGQGCVGILRALQLADQFLHLAPDQGDVLVVTGCRASTVTRNLSHGAFFWGDGAAAAILSAEPGSGLHYVSYAESSSEADWGAMRIPHGDGMAAESCVVPDDLLIDVRFESAADQMLYIQGEQDRFATTLNNLVAAGGIGVEDVSALFLPSFGRNRVPQLLERFAVLRDRLGTDFRYGHMGGVDNLLFLDHYVEHRSPPDGVSSLCPSMRT